MTSSINQTNTMGIFYKIKDKDQVTKGYVYGTVHVIFGDPNFCLNNKVKMCFDKSTNLIVENDILSGEQLNFISTDIDKRIEFLKNKDIPSIDLKLLINAHEAKKNVMGLETIEEQEPLLKEYKEEYGKNIFQKFLNLPMNEERMTKEELKFNNEFNEISKLKDIAHKTSDEEVIDKIARYGCSEEFYKKFNDERNERMVEKIDSYLQTKGKHFIAVGAGHTVSEAGIVNLLRKKGWVLQKIV
jgi:uncharacterized protein YbaP (TraB family)